MSYENKNRIIKNNKTTTKRQQTKIKLKKN